MLITSPIVLHCVSVYRAPLDGDTAEALTGKLAQVCTVNDDLLSTYRIFFPPQMCSLGAALLREEGVKIGGFPLTAAPVFHPGEAGKTNTHWNFSNRGTSIKNTTNRKANRKTVALVTLLLQFSEKIYKCIGMKLQKISLQ